MTRNDAAPVWATEASQQLKWTSEEYPTIRIDQAILELLDRWLADDEEAAA